MGMGIYVKDMFCFIGEGGTFEELLTYDLAMQSDTAVVLDHGTDVFIWLMIPRNFVKKYGEYLPKAICLKTPNGADWKLSLVESDGKIWFQKGWKKFADYHSLYHGHLVFEYESTSRFEVRIFDKSALKIKYPFKRAEVNNEEDCRASQKRKAYSSFDIGSTSCVKKHKGKQVNTTLKRAKEFKTCNPSFVVVMGASYVGSRFLLGAELVADEGKSAAALAACRTLAEELTQFRFPAPRILAFKVQSHVDIYHFDDETWGGSFDMPKEMAHSHLRMVTDGRYIY
ncbi:putative B3 domain-containing protein Os03g0619850 isoform X2 [Vicia villosa]|uniref:putative B3 domain-containing protein Os03g0619850 isoform X2 n=1 Tax=Vicia villosa TaxID=3911 RepID=UPI00273C09AF|nr:putative B3 domain-containing protein Os03g0619850 isoform X2 [Vicia villosa]